MRVKMNQALNMRKSPDICILKYNYAFQQYKVSHITSIYQIYLNYFFKTNKKTYCSPAAYCILLY